MKLYAAGLYAQCLKSPNVLQTQVQAVTVRAEDDANAHWEALRYAKETAYPEKDGWFNHQVALSGVPEKWYKED